MLPSSLFYHSTLQCCVKDRESHPESPFPLNFVCSSMEEDVRNISGVNPDEIEVLLKETQKYFCRWPKNWSKKDRRVCIMSPSANQVTYDVIDCRLFFIVIQQASKADYNS